MGIFLTWELKTFLQTLKALVLGAGTETEPGSYPEWDMGASTARGERGERISTDSYKVMGYVLRWLSPLYYAPSEASIYG